MHKYLHCFLVENFTFFSEFHGAFAAVNQLEFKFFFQFLYLKA